MSAPAHPQIVLNKAYNEKVDVYSFGLTLLEIAVGDCTYVKKHWGGGLHCVVSEANGGLGWRPPVPDELLVAQPSLALLYEDCVLDDFNERPSFMEILTRLESCEASAAEYDPVEEVVGKMRGGHAADDHVAAATFRSGTVHSPAHRGDFSVDDSQDDPAGTSSVLLSNFDATEAEVASVITLQSELGNTATTQPQDVGGDVALLRFLRFAQRSVAEAKTNFTTSMLLRGGEGTEPFDAAKCRAELFNAHDGSLKSFSELTGAEELQTVWPHRDRLGFTRDGAGLLFHESFAGVDPAGLAAMDEARYIQLCQARVELKFVLLDRISRSRKRIVLPIYTVDVSGLRLEHRRAIPRYKLRQRAIHPVRYGVRAAKKILVIGVGPMAHGLLGIVKPFLSNELWNTVEVLGPATSTKTRVHLEREFALDVLSDSLGIVSSSRVV